jgi:NADPH:quinone reductase
MRAWVCRSYETPFRIAMEEVETPVCKPGDVLIRVRAVGLNFGETVLLEGRYQTQPSLPYIPVSECSGVVVEVGTGVETCRPGDEVFGFSFDIRGGSLAEYVCLPADYVFVKPAHMSFAEAAAFPINYWTAYHALYRRSALKPGERLVVFGAGGGIGLAGIHVGKALGAEVIAVAGGKQKLDLASQQGADHVLDHRGGDLRDAIRALTGGKGADVYLDPVGGPMFEIAMRAIAPAGRILVVGFTSGEHAVAKTNILLVKMASVVGVYAGAVFDHQRTEAMADFATMLDWVERDKVTPTVSAVYMFAEAESGLRDIAARRHVGKSVVVMEADIHH